MLRKLSAAVVAASLATAVAVVPAQAGTQDFSFEQTADPAPAAPAAAPATGGGEFEP